MCVKLCEAVYEQGKRPFNFRAASLMFTYWHGTKGTLTRRARANKKRTTKKKGA